MIILIVVLHLIIIVLLKTQGARIKQLHPKAGARTETLELNEGGVEAAALGVDCFVWIAHAAALSCFIMIAMIVGKGLGMWD